MSDVKLYVYDLSHGLAKQMSLMLTGKQIDGIWHTSVVAFGREIFFGQGILEAKPGTTHHGQPLQIIDCGKTEIDEATFEEYLSSLRELYTADKYHLTDFNCNHFTADVVGFLTGATIPSWISGLPTEFLSTPFGQAMRPQIDAMFRKTAPTEHPVNHPDAPAPPSIPTPAGSGSATPNGLASSLLGSVAAQATTNGSGSSAPGAPTAAADPTPETSPLTLVTSTVNFHSILKQHQAVIANFTNTQGCAPCRAIKPVYESIAAECAPTFGVKGARFVEVELGVGQGRDIASQYNVSATPTFIFFRDGKKVTELRGASKKELENTVLDFLESIWPTHPHRKTYIAGLERLPISPITSSTVPKYPALVDKIKSFGVSGEDLAVLKDQVVPLLEQKGASDAAKLRTVIDAWLKVTDRLVATLKFEQTFPVIDLLRVGLVNNQIATTFAFLLNSGANNSLQPIFGNTSSLLKSQGAATPKPLLLTVLRLLTNLLAVLPLAHLVLKSSQEAVTAITVDSLLHEDSGVRSAAAGVAFNLASVRHRDAKQRHTPAEDFEEQSWEVELVSALVEGIGREADEDVAHRLIAALGLALFLAPGYDESLKPLLEVLEAKSTLEAKAKEYKNKEVKKLALDVAAVC